MSRWYCLALICSTLSCDDGAQESELACSAEASNPCSPQYAPPVFDTIFDKILRPTCAAGGASCHASSGRQGGLVLDDRDQAYALLVGQADGRARVVAGDAPCSLLSRRIRASDPARRMPPGPTPLTDGEICTITQWIAAGARR